MVAVLFCILTGHSAVRAMNSSELESLTSLSQWPAYVSAVQYYQVVSPAVFSPLELLRLDLLKFSTLSEQVKTVGSEWETLEKKTRSKAVLEEKESLSRKANDWLHVQFRKEKISPHGTHLKILKSMKITQRYALTPMDGLFQNTEIGKKIANDLKSRSEFEVRSLKFLKEKQAIVFEGVPVVWGKNSKVAALPIYQITAASVEDGSVVKLRAQFIDKAEAAYPDLKFRKEYLGGSFFDSKSSGRFLLGPMPQQKSIFLDEGGTSHFSGDGHKH